VKSVHAEQRTPARGCRHWHRLGRSTVHDILQRHRVPPAPTRQCLSNTWHAFLSRHQDQIVACDFFTIETLFLKPVYILFFIELGTRRVHVAGCRATRSC
jgi:putative transposase